MLTWEHTRLVIAPGSYDETLVIDQPIRLVGAGGSAVIGE